jgi:glycosyltransferase involved in cell wall biosynthesis
MAEYKNGKSLVPRIELLQKELDLAKYVRMYREVDCFVHPHRAEGFAIPIVESMLMELPVIVPDTGVARDYCNDVNCYLIPTTREACRDDPCDATQPNIAKELPTPIDPFWYVP